MRNFFAVFILTTGISLPAASFAQAPATDPLSFSQALKLAFVNDQDLQAAEYDYQSALTTRAQSKAALLPLINAIAFTSETDNEIENSSNPATLANGDDDYDTEGYSLTLQQSIYRHRNYKILQQTDLSISAATSTVVAERQSLIVRLAEAYFNVLGAQDNLKFATAEKEAIEKQLEQSKKRFEVGLIAITDVKEAQASYDTSVAQEIDAQNILDASLEALAVILGNYNSSIAPMKAEIPLLPPTPADIQQWTQMAVQNNLVYKAAQFNFQAAQKKVDADQSEHYPYVDLNAEHSYTELDDPDLAYDSTDTVLTLQLTVPIYSGGFTSAQHKQSIALKEKARSEKEKAHRQAIQQTRDAYLGVSSSIAQVRAFKQALLSTQTAYEATQAGFEAGTRTAIDVLASLREVYRAERDYARARYTYVINTLRLKQATGTLSMDDGRRIDDFLE